jgi:phosphoribosylformylglycinamidine synthase
VVRLPGTEVAVALSLDGPGRFCLLDPYRGARLAVAEAARNVACAGARPLAVTNCLNLGNPERPEVAWQLAEVVRGIADACTALRTPVVGGNVSLYNETGERAIQPTPVIGALGVIDDASRAIGAGFNQPGDAIVLLGSLQPGGFAGSDYAKVVNTVVGGRPPVVDLDAEARLAAVLVEGARRGLVTSAHDVSSGGLALCLAECAVSASVGFEVGCGGHDVLFSESPGRVVVSVSPTACAESLRTAEAAGVPAEVIGAVGGDMLAFGTCALALEQAHAAYRAALPDALSSAVVV